MNAEAGRAETRVQTLQNEQRDAYRKTRKMIEVAKDLEIKVTRETIIKAARSFPKEDQEATTPNRHTTISDDVNMAEPSIATAPKTRRLVLNPPKRERSPSMETRRPYQPRSSQPKQKKSVAVECILLRLGQPKRKDLEQSQLPLKNFRSRGLKLSQPKP